MKIISKKSKIREALQNLAPRTIATAYIGSGWKKYINPETLEEIDITQLNAQLKTTVAKIDQLRTDIDTIVAEIEGTKNTGAKGSRA